MQTQYIVLGYSINSFFMTVVLQWKLIKMDTVTEILTMK